MVEYDVVIIGNSIASNLFARHLNLTNPNLRIVIIGPMATPKYTVGESVTELASHYLQHRLKLTSYMYRNQIYKNGLRFFYNKQDLSVPLESMSEGAIGTTLLFNTFHIDRHVFERDLKVMNQESGIEYIDGLVDDFGFEDTRNRVVVKTGAELRTVYGRWLCDGSGQRAMVARRLGLITRPVNARHCSVWGHFKAKTAIDFGSPKFKQRTFFCTREFSTVHFFHHGYWFWVIPIRDNIISLGVVYDNALVFQDGPPDQAGFLEFIHKHPAIDGLFSKDECVNFKFATNYSYISQQFVLPEKHCLLLGDAGAFVDPLYSSGLDVLARESDLFVDLIQRDVTGSLSAPEYNSLCDKINLIVENDYRYYITINLGTLECVGSKEIGSAKYLLEFFSYYTNYLWPYVARVGIPDSEYAALEYNLRFGISIFQFATSNFKVLAEKYRREGLYYRKNEDHRVFVARAMYVEHTIANISGDRINKIKSDTFLEILQYTFIFQLQLYFKRKDLLSHRTLYKALTYSSLAQYALEIEHDPLAFFHAMGQLIERDETAPVQDDFWHDWMADPREGFWKNWIARTKTPVVTKYSGDNFKKFTLGMPYLVRPNHLNVPEYFDAEVRGISVRFQDVESSPRSYLQQPSDDLHLEPFMIEACAAGLIAEGRTIPDVVKRLTEQFPDVYLPLIYIGCGYGLFKGSVHALTDAALGPYLDQVLDGYGFAMGLTNYFEMETSITFPSVHWRGPLVRGFGRSVTFFPNEANDAVKYERYFRFFDLYPEDVSDYYYGVGFSLTFTQRDRVGIADRIREMFAEPERAYVLRGSAAALDLWNAIQSQTAQNAIGSFEPFRPGARLDSDPAVGRLERSFY